MICLENEMFSFIGCYLIYMCLFYFEFNFVVFFVMKSLKYCVIIVDFDINDW